MANETEYVIRLLLKARDDMNGVLTKAKAEIETFTKSSDDLDRSLSAVNDQVTSLNKRSSAAAANLNKVAAGLDKVKTSVKEFVTDEKDLEAALERNIGHLHGQTGATVVKSEATKSASASLREHQRASAESDAQLKKSRDEWGALTRKVKENEDAVKSSRTELNKILTDGGQQSLGQKKKISLYEEAIKTLEDPALKKRAEAAYQNLFDASAQTKDLVDANAVAEQAHSAAKARFEEAEDMRRKAARSADAEAASLNKVTRERERARAQADTHRGDKPTAAEDTPTKLPPLTISEQSKETRQHNSAIREEARKARERVKDVNRQIRQDKKALGVEKNPDRIYEEGFRGDPKIVRRLVDNIHVNKSAAIDDRDRTKSVVDNFDVRAFEASLKQRDEAVAAQAAEVVQAVAQEMVEEAIPSKGADKPAPKVKKAKAQRRVAASEPPADSDAWEKDGPSDDEMEEPEGWKTDDFSDLLDPDDLVMMAGGARGGASGGAAGGGRKKKTVKERQTEKYRELKKEYEAATRSLLDYTLALTRGDTTEEEWNIKREVTLKTLDKAARGFAKLNSLGIIANQELKRVLNERKRVISQYDPIAERALAESVQDVIDDVEEASSDEGSAAHPREETLRERTADEERRRQLRARKAAQDDEEKRLEHERLYSRAGEQVQRTQEVVGSIQNHDTLTENDVEKLNRQAAVLELLQERLRRAARAYADSSDEAQNYAARSRVLNNALSDVNRRLNEHNNRMRQASSQYQGILGRLGQFQHAVTKNSDGLATLDNKIQGLIVLAVLAFTDQLISALLSLGGALGAVASSAAFAGGAIGGALVAGVAQALPAVGLLIAALTRVKEVMDVGKQAELVKEQEFTRAKPSAKKRADTADAVANAKDVLENAQEGVGDAKEGVADAKDGVVDAHEALRDAIRGVADAEDGLVDANDALSKSQEAVAEAHEKVAEAQRGLTTARRDAIKDIRDLIQAEREAELAARGAALSQGEAQEALRQAIAGGDVEGIERAELRVAEADQGVNAANNSLDDAREGRRQADRGVEAQDVVVAAKDRIKDARDGVGDAQDGVKDARKGVEDAKEGVRDARRGVVDARDDIADAEKAVLKAERGVLKAERAVEKASRGVEKARRGATAAGEDSFAAAEKLQYMLAQLSPAERRLYEAMNRLKEAYKENIRPITDIIIGEFANGVDSLAVLMGDPRVLGGLTRMAKGVAGSMKDVRQAFTAGPIVDQMVRITDQGTKSLKPLTAIAISLGKAFLNIAEAAGPSLLRILNYFKGVARDIEVATGNSQKMEKFFKGATDSLLLFFDAIGATIRLLAELADAGKPTGDNILKDYTDYVNGLADSIGKNDKGVRSFFEESRRGLYILLPLLPALGKALMEVFDPDRMAPLVDFMVETLFPALTTAIQIIGGFTTIIFKLLNLPLVSELTQVVIVLVLLNKTWRASLGLVGGIMGRLLGMSKAVDTAFGGKLNSMFGSLATGMGGVFTRLGHLLRRLPLVGAAFTRMGDAANAAGARAAAGASAAGAAGDAANPYEDADTSNPYDDAANGNGPNGPDPDGDGQPGTSRRRRIARGVGAAALVGGGAYAMSQQDTKSLSQAAGIGKGLGDQNDFGLGQVGGALGQLTSFDFGGFAGSIKGAFKGTEPLTKFAKDFNKDLDRLSKKRDTKGLEDLRDKANDLATQYPKYSEALREAANRTDNAANETKDLNKRLEATKDVAASLRKRGVILDERTLGSVNPNLLKDIDFYLKALRRGIPETLKELRRDVRAQMDRINAALVDPSGIRKKGYYEAMAETINAQIRNLRRLRKEGKISEEEYDKNMRGLVRSTKLLKPTGEDIDEFASQFARKIKRSKKPVRDTVEEIKEDLNKMPINARRAAAAAMLKLVEQNDKGKEPARKSLARVRAALGREYQDIRDKNVKRVDQLSRGTGTIFGGLGAMVKGPLESFSLTVNEALKKFGAKSVDPSVSVVPFKLTPSQLKRFTGDKENDATGGIVGRGSSFFSQAGIVGREGERGKDEIPAMIGRGEMVLNAGHQRYIAPAVEAFYGHPLGKTFQRIRGFHAGGYQDGFTGFAGGFAGKSPAGLKTVPIPGFPGEFIAQRVVKDAVALARRFKMTITDAFATSGHSGAGHLKFGTAMDTVPGPGGSWATVNNAIKYATSKGLTVLYDGRFGSRKYPNHGEGHHAHFELEPGKIDAKGGEGVTDVPAKVKLPKFTVKGRGAQQRLINRALDQVRRGAQAKVDKAREEALKTADAASSAGNITTEGISADNGVLKTLIDVWRKNKLPYKALLSAVETGIVESGLRNLSGGDRDSAGWRQERASLYKDPTNVVASAARFYNEWRQHNDAGESAGEVAAQVQRPAAQYRGRYDQVKGQAERLIRKAGVGASKAVGGYVGKRSYADGGSIAEDLPDGKPVNILAHAGEWIFNKAQQSKLARLLGTTRSALKAAMGFGGSNTRGFAAGGEVSDSTKRLNELYNSSAERTRAGNASGGIYDLPAFPIDEWQDVKDEIQRALRAFKNTGKGWVTRLKAVQKSIRDIRAETSDADDAEIAKLRRGGTSKSDRRKIREIKQRISDNEKKEIAELEKEENLLTKGVGKTRREQRRSRTIARREANLDEQLNAVGEVIKEGGLFDQATTQRERQAGKRSRSNVFGRFARSAAGSFLGSDKSVVDQRGPDSGVADANDALEDARASYDEITRQVALSEGAMGELKGRLDKLKKGGIKENESEQARKLETQLARAREQYESIRGSQADGLTALFEAQTARQQAIIDKINKDAERSTRGNDLARRVAAAVGNDDLVAKINASQLDTLRKQAADLTPRIAAAKAIGNHDLAEQLQDQVNDINTTIYEGVQEAAKNARDAVNRAFERRGRGIDLRRRIASAFGNRGELAQLDNEQRQMAVDQVQALTAQLNNAKALGNTGLAQEISDQIEDLNISIVEMTAQSFRTAVDTINEKATEGLARADYMSRAADVFGKLGLDSSVGGMTRRGAFAARGAALTTQRGDLSNTLMRVMMEQPENVGLIKDLTQQIRDLDLSIQENSKALFDARVEDTNARFSRADTILGLREQIMQARGTLEGQVNNAGLLEYARERTGLLATQGAELSRLLDEARASGNEEAVQSLTEQLLQNELATIANSQSIKELTGATTQPQSYSSIGWREFHEAIYNGMGDVLPQYTVPSATGSVAMRSSGVLDPGGADPITPAYMEDYSKNAGTIVNEGDINFEINEAGGGIDMTRLASTVAFAKKTAQR